MAKKILVVDDDPVVIKLVETMLKNRGFDVDTAVDGLDALAKIKTSDPALIILDVMMPEINGYDVCYQLRFNDDFKRIPIILLTSRARELDKKISDRSNISYISKPVDANLILKEIEVLLDGKKTEDG